MVYQHPKSPFNIASLGDKSLPRLHFTPKSPVYFDRHTLSIKDGQASMFTLDGRMRFHIELTPEVERRFRTEKLREIVLTSNEDCFSLGFLFADPLIDQAATKRGQLDEGFETVSRHVQIVPSLAITPTITTAVPAPMAATAHAPAAAASHLTR